MRPSGPVTEPPAGTQVPPDQMSRLTGTPAAGRPAVRSRMCVETVVMASLAGGRPGGCGVALAVADKGASCCDQLSQPDVVDLADLRRSDLPLGGGVVRHPAVQLGQDLRLAAAGGADQ